MNEQAKKKRPGPRIEAGNEGTRKWAATILQVLAGEWTPSEGALALGVSMARYYSVELRAIRELLRGCEPSTGKRRRRPAVRALKMAAVLCEPGIAEQIGEAGADK